MTFRIYYKKFIDGENKPVLCSKADNYHVVDFSVLKEDVGKSFNPESPKNLEKVKSVLLKSNGGEVLNFKDSYIGESTITWHFSKSVVDDGEIDF